MKPLRDMTEAEIAQIAMLPVPDRCLRILEEFDYWLALHVVHFKLAHDDLPQLNDAFRGYFADTRTAKTEGAR